MKPTPRQLATILAALRYWQTRQSTAGSQRVPKGPITPPSGFQEYFNQHEPLSVEEIYALEEELNP